MKQLKKEQDKTYLDKLRAEMAERRAKVSETSEHNTEYKATPSTPDNRTKPKNTRTGASRPEHNADHKNEQTPDNRPKAKAKTGPSPRTNLPPFPTGEKASGSQDNPQSTHEPKGNPGRPKNTQGPKPNTQGPQSNNQGPPPVRKTKNKDKSNPNPIPTPSPKHDTDVNNSTDFNYWKDENLTRIKDQLNKQGFRKHRNPDGSGTNKPHYLAVLRKMLNENTWLMMD